MTYQSTCLAIALIAAVPAIASAETSKPQQHASSAQEGADKPWSVTVGAGVGYGSLYEGGSERQVFPLPIFEATYYSWSIGMDGLRYQLVNQDRLSAGVGLGYDFGREDKKDNVAPRARGIGDVDGGLSSSAYLEYQALDWLGLSADLTKSYGDADSLLLTVGAGTEFPIYGESLSGNLGLSATWANEDHMRSYYSVNNAQAARTGLRQFKAGSGIEKVNFSAGVNYAITDRWVYQIAGGVDVLQGDAADSPIIEDDVQPFIFNSISYSF